MYCAAVASAAFVAYTIGMTTMRFGGDSLQARLGRMGLHRLSLTIAAIGFVVASLIPNQTVSIVGFLLAGLGVATLLLVVPLPLAALHQAGAAMLFGLAIWVAQSLCGSK